MQDSPHSLLVGNGATKFAKKIGFLILTDPLELISEESRLQLKGIKNFKNAVHTSFNTDGCTSTDESNLGHDTVGAVAMDSLGHLACATSTGEQCIAKAIQVGDFPNFLLKCVCITTDQLVRKALNCLVMIIIMMII